MQASISDGELKREAVTVAVVGRDMSFTILDNETLDSAIAALDVRARAPLQAWCMPCELVRM